MTMIKTKGVESRRHFKNLENYLNDPKAIYREVWNLYDINDWAFQMDSIRKAYGHDVAPRGTEKNIIALHQILAFNPDDCDMNGGKLGPYECMDWARDWVAKEYPNQQVLMVLHREKAKDGTERYAVHLGINRTDLVTGKRYRLQKPTKAAHHRASLARQMDKERGLRKTIKGQRNVRTHAQAETRAEREIKARGGHTWKDDIRDAIRQELSRPDCGSLVALQRGLRERHNIEMNYTRSKKECSFTLEGHRAVRGSTLGEGFDRANIMATFEQRENNRIIEWAKRREEIRARVHEALQTGERNPNKIVKAATAALKAHDELKAKQPEERLATQDIREQEEQRQTTVKLHVELAPVRAREERGSDTAIAPNMSPKYYDDKKQEIKDRYMPHSEIGKQKNETEIQQQNAEDIKRTYLPEQQEQKKLFDPDREIRMTAEQRERYVDSLSDKQFEQYFSEKMKYEQSLTDAEFAQYQNALDGKIGVAGFAAQAEKATADTPAAKAQAIKNKYLQDQTKRDHEQYRQRNQQREQRQDGRGRDR